MSVSVTDVMDYVRGKGWEYKERGSELVVKACPFCNDESGHLYIERSTGLWHCHKCQESGNLLVMRRRLGDLELKVRSFDHLFYKGARGSQRQLGGKRPREGLDKAHHEKLWESPEALRYLREVRGFTDDTLRSFQVGYGQRNGTSWLAYPYYSDSELVNVKYRTLPPAEKDFQRVAGCPSTLFNVDALKDLRKLPVEERTVLLCESESDAMALVQLGYKRTVATSTGAGSWNEDWLGPLEPASDIVLCYDSDEAGQAGAVRAAEVLGRYRCRVAAPPLKDFGELLAAGLEPDAVREIVDNAKPYDDETVLPLESFAGKLKATLRGPRPRGRPTGWMNLDALWGGIRDKEMTVVTGHTGTGKSTWALANALERSRQGEPVLVAPFEQPPEDVLATLVSMTGEKSVYDQSKLEVDEYVAKLSELNLYVLNRYGKTPLGAVRDALYHAVRRFGVRFAVFDHLHFFLNSRRAEEERFDIDVAVRAIKEWAKDLGAHLFVVVQPAKLGTDARGQVRQVELDDLKGSSEIEKTADTVMRVWRDRSEKLAGTKTGRTVITILKCRSPAGGEGSCWYEFDVGSQQYMETAPPKRKRKKKEPEGEVSDEGMEDPTIPF